MKVIGNTSNYLAKVVQGLMPEWMVFQLIIKTDGKDRGGTEEHGHQLVKSRCTALIFCMTLRFVILVYDKKVKQGERDLMFRKTRVFSLLK